MHSQGAHIVTRCQWNTAFDSKGLAYQLQTDISTWSSYKMKRIIDRVFDSICPKGQTLKIKKLAVDLGTMTYENMLSELPLRLEEALRNALYDLILYPKNGDKTLEIIHEDIAQINVLRDFLLQGILPWNYQESYGTASQIMRLQLLNNRLDVIQMIQQTAISENVRKRIAWQFPDATIKKIIAGLEPNNHQQIIAFSEEFVKVQEKETIVQTSTNDLKKNIWLWILNYLFTERGTIFNKVAFVRSTIVQMANHFNISYDTMIELIEDAIDRANEYSQVDKGFIAILRLLSEELHNKSFSQVKTAKQKENFWLKIETYFNSAAARNNNVQKNEFNELVIHLSKVDAKRFQKIVLNVAHKPTTWKPILKDLIPAAIENLFVVLSPSESKNILTQILFLSKVYKTARVKIDPLDLYTFGIEFCVETQHTSISKNAFLAFVVEKLAKQQQQTKLAILDHFVTADVTNTQKKTAFISLFKALNGLYQQEISSAKTFSSAEKLQHVVTRYVTEIHQSNQQTEAFYSLEKTLQKWISASPTKFWEVFEKIDKTPKLTVHITALISVYGTERFLSVVVPEIVVVLSKIQQIIDVLIAKHPKKATTLRALKNGLITLAFEAVWHSQKANTTEFFIHLLQRLLRQETSLKVSKNDIQEVIELLLETPKIRTLAWSAYEFASIQKAHKIQLNKTPLQEIIERIAQPNQQIEVAKSISKLVHAKKITTSEFKAKEATLISYLVSNGMQLRKRLLAQFLKQVSATTTYNNNQIKELLQDCFWQSLVQYQTHRGNERRFVNVFETNILHTFPVVKTSEILQEKIAIVAKTNPAQTQVLATPYHISVAVLFEALISNLKTTNAQFEISNTNYKFSALFAVGLETSPAKIRTIIQETVATEKQLTFLRNQIKFEEFIVFMSHDVSSSKLDVYKAIHVLVTIAKQLGNTTILKALEAIFWKQTIAFIQQKKSSKKVLENLVKTTFDKLSEIATLDQITIVKHIQNNRYNVPEILKTVLIERHRIFELVSGNNQQRSLSEAIKNCISAQKIEFLSEFLITQYKIPAWFQHKEAYTYSRILNELIAQQPLVILKTLRDPKISEVQQIHFVQTIHFDTFITALQKLYTAQYYELSNIHKLYESMGFVNIRGISTKSLQEIIIKKVVTAWQTSHWNLITSTRIWNELLWETCGKKAVRKQDFFTAVNTIKTMLPTALLVTYKNLISLDTAAKSTKKEITLKKLNKSPMNTASTTFPQEGVSIPNAGLVMLNNYFLMLLDRLGVTEDNNFISEEAQLDSIHYLQYIVTGLTETEESLLTLNKILVGLSPNVPVKNSIEMTSEQKELIDGMITASIQHWTAIGETSVDGFRGNWLVRDGILIETEDRWELTVEKRAYDILMTRSPFSFSIIKLPWMSKPLHVTWPF
ncbi:contractile injection system tape measure protein [Kordia algicida OT-1]|uniref:Uncharacterized protein n=1 Tax=Kordia algicida OT-1 TaxID=391587 RepID=A9DNG8_9FLAO|nr:contractile injection system tape measure protein [Kordia algicida]EDP97188.1 hypothetical protein KAOT1_18537 [Kordia algicida OT-1]